MILTCLAAALALGDAPITVKVLVVIYDPVVDGKPLHVYMKWNDPHNLADGYISDVKECSGGFVRYKIVEWRNVNQFPLKKDGYRYTPEAFTSIWSKKAKPHQPDAVDYANVIHTQHVEQAIDSGKADELWVFGAPNFGFFESCMAGPNAYWINGDVVPDIETKRAFAIMGFSYERGVAEMIHDLAHRTENHLARAYGRWKAKAANPNMWERFSAYTKADGYAGCGNCHFPPNATHDYDYADTSPVQSNADQWLQYPNVGNETKPVNKDTWGGPDYQRNYLKWWFSHLPKLPGKTPDGRPMNWWKYVFDFNNYDEHGLHK